MNADNIYFEGLLPIDNRINTVDVRDGSAFVAAATRPDPDKGAGWSVRRSDRRRRSHRLRRATSPGHGVGAMVWSAGRSG